MLIKGNIIILIGGMVSFKIMLIKCKVVILIKGKIMILITAR